MQSMGVIAAFAAGEVRNGLRGNCLAGLRQAFDMQHHIHVDAAEYGDAHATLAVDWTGSTSGSNRSGRGRNANSSIPSASAATTSKTATS